MAGLLRKVNMEVLISVFFLFYALIVCALAYELSSRVVTTTKSQPVVVQPATGAWQDEVKGIIDTLPLNGHKAKIVELIDEFNDPVLFMEYLERALDETEYELLGRDVPYG